MKKQDYSNHVRYYVPHHFVLYPLLFVLIVASLFIAWRNPGQSLSWKLFAVSLAIAGWISYMMRQHYALTLQNRIVRLEMRLRYFQLTGQRFEPFEQQLSVGQIAALRFASDEELAGMVNRTLEERLAPSAIKQSIRNWTPDHMRV